VAASDQDPMASVALIDGQGQVAAAGSSTNADGTHTLQLSLFLMLLTFFFVLTSVSCFDERRVGPVIGGIQDAFGALHAGAVHQTGRLSRGTLPVLQDGSQPASGDFSNAVIAAFADVGEQETVRHSGSLDLVLDVSGLFVEGGAGIRC